ncbi:F0F1 ATP synthase subunit B [Candidatus Gottesmanbacteria bacterium]|nr:F0F1 ATP synthase subunit B [Candidatus Gottesmanbacteria bacterium]
MEQLGIQPTQLLLQIFNFLILMYLLKRFLYKPVQKLLEERKKKIEDGLKFSDKAKQELEESQNKRDEIIKKAKEETKEIIAQAKKDAKIVEQDLIRQAQIEAQNILQKAKKDIELERQYLKKRIETETIDIATIMVSKILQEILDEREHRQIIGKKIATIARRIQKE